MRTWLRGRWVGLAVFAGVACLVLGGMGWITRAALHLEGEQLASRAEADIRLALWRLDSRVFTDLARVADQSLQEFDPQPVPPKGSDATREGLVVLRLEPVGKKEPTSWVRGHFVTARRGDWPSSSALARSWGQGLNLADRKGKPNALPDELALFLQDLGRDERIRLALASTQLPTATGNPGVPGQAFTQAPIPRQSPAEALNAEPNSPEAQGSYSQQRASRDATLRRTRSQTEFNQQAAFPNNSAVPDNYARPSLAVLSPMVPGWLGEGSEVRLAMTRTLAVADKPACQVTLLDWPELRKLLEEEARDLVPGVRLYPLRGESPSNPDRAMSALPVELDPGPPNLGEAALGLNPLRVGLFLAWTASLVALLAVGLGGWSLFGLAERRTRFVSAVTHELRTPLTTLRLYLDMLATGMVTEEARKTEYIQTLNQETDRLNRLVGNVLDFSRLENQRPRLQRTPVTLADLLAQVSETWEGRCRAAGKHLVLANDLPHDLVLTTDVQLVSQILGNLIDNACKYSQGAEDPSVWFRARDGGVGRIVFEVEDRGVGVARQERRAIFRPFRRGCKDVEPAGGVGLGLALARRWAYLLGGRLTLGKATGDVGACFRLVLPRDG